MQRMGTPKSAVKEAGAWVTEKASRAKFAGIATRMRVCVTNTEGGLM